MTTGQTTTLLGTCGISSSSVGARGMAALSARVTWFFSPVPRLGYGSRWFTHVVTW